MIINNFLIWPVGNLLAVLNSHPSKKNVVKPYPNEINDLIAPITGTIPKIILAYIVYTVQYPELLSQANNWQQSRVLSVIFRNVLGTLVICCSWDWLLYLSPFKNIFFPYKFNVEYPPTSQLLHDMFWTISSSFWASVLECLALHWWATGILSHCKLIYRAMHPWRTKIIPDIGKTLYLNVHALH